jgi:hypothetical protein
MEKWHLPHTLDPANLAAGTVLFTNRLDNALVLSYLEKLEVPW